MPKRVLMLLFCLLLPFKGKGHAAPIARVHLEPGQLVALGHEMTGDVTFTITSDSTNVLISDGRVTVPLVVRDPRDPVFSTGPEDPFTLWRNELVHRLQEHSAQPDSSIAAEMVDSLLVRGCRVTARRGSYIFYNEPSGEPVIWRVVRDAPKVPATFMLQSRIHDLLTQLRLGKAVFVLWSGRDMTMSSEEASRLMLAAHAMKAGQSGSFPSTVHPDVATFLLHPFTPIK